jgi:hypothetical protein
MSESNEPPKLPPMLQRAALRMSLGRVADDLSQPILKRLAETVWIGQDEIDPPTAGRSVESARDRGDLYLVLNILAETKLISYRKGYAASRPGFPATRYFWFRLTPWGRIFRRWPSSLRRLFLLVVWFSRWTPLRRIVSAAALVVAVIKGWHGAWADFVLALAVLVALISGPARPAFPAETMDT